MKVKVLVLAFIIGLSSQSFAQDNSTGNSVDTINIDQLINRYS